MGAAALQVLHLLQKIWGSWGCRCGTAGLGDGAAHRLWMWEPGELGCDKEGLGRQELHGTVVSAVLEARGGFSENERFLNMTFGHIPKKA